MPAIEINFHSQDCIWCITDGLAHDSGCHAPPLYVPDSIKISPAPRKPPVSARVYGAVAARVLVLISISRVVPRRSDRFGRWRKSAPILWPFRLAFCAHWAGDGDGPTGQSTTPDQVWACRRTWTLHIFLTSQLGYHSIWANTPNYSP